jgi:FkbM family methyltransferase
MASNLESFKRHIYNSRLGPLAVEVRRLAWPRARLIQWQDGSNLLRIISYILREDSCCIDVGAHLGTVVEHMCRLAPKGRHLAFEPLPYLAAGLRERLPGIEVHEVALSDEAGEMDFHHVVTNPGYSGFRPRRYDRPEERVEVIRVRACRLDDVVGEDQRVDFVKIDVEGAELQVLRGAVRTLAHWQPYVVFEHGPGAADHYGTSPEAMHHILDKECGLSVFTLDGAGPFSPPEFAAMFASNRVSNFLARPYAATSRRS